MTCRELAPGHDDSPTLPERRNGSGPGGPTSRLAVRCLILFVSAYLLTYKGLTLDDGAFHHDVARNFLATGCFCLPEGEPPTGPAEQVSGQAGPSGASSRAGTPYTGAKDSVFWKRGREERLYLALAPGMTALMVPLTAMGLGIEKASGLSYPSTWAWAPRLEGRAADEHFRALRRRPSVFAGFLLNPLATAALVTVLFLFLTQLSRPGPAPLLAACSVGLTTTLWPLSGTDWTQPLTILLLFGSLFLVHRSVRSTRVIEATSAGLCAGLAVLVRYDAILTLPWLVLGLILEQGTSGRRARLVRFVLPIVVCLLLILAWNQYRFGTPLDTGTKHQESGQLFGRRLAVQLPVALLANVLGAGQGLLVFSPVLLVSTALLGRLRRREPSLTLCILGIALTNLVFYSAFRLWQTPESWGPRFLSLLVPFLALPLSTLTREDARALRLFACASALGLAIQLPGICHPITTGVREALPLLSVRSPDLVGVLSTSPIPPQLASIASGQVDFWWSRGPLPALGAILLLALGLSAARSAWKLASAESR